MNDERHTSLRNILVLTLCLLPEGALSKGLFQLSGGMRETLVPILESLRAEDFVDYDAREDRWLKREAPRWTQLVDETWEALRGENTEDALVEGLTRLYDRRWLEGGESFLLLIRNLLEKGLSAGAVVCLDLILHALRNVDEPGSNESVALRFVAAYKAALGASLFMGKRRDATFALLDKARRMSLRWGDERSMLQLNLYQAIAHQVGASHNTDLAFSRISNALRDIRNFEDSELYDSISPVIGVNYQIEGDFREARKFLKARDPNRIWNILDYLAEIDVRYRAGGLFSIGHYASSVGLLEGSLREARLKGLLLLEKWRQAQLAQFLIWMGKRDIGLEYLDAVLCRTDPASETKLWFFCAQILAFYFFYKGDVTKAHHVLFSAMQGLVKNEEQRPFYGFPNMLELFWAFEQQGLPGIPGYDCRMEMALALRSPNKLFRSTALRLKAAEQAAEGERSEIVIETLRESLFYVESLKIPIDIARTRLALSRHLKAIGEHHEADALYRQACGVLSAFRQHDCPEEYASEKKNPAPPEPVGLSNLESLRRLLNKEVLFVDGPYMAQHLVNSVCEEMDLERAALFETENLSLTCIGSCNIFQAELDSSLFTKRKDWLISLIGTHTTVMAAEKDFRRLCLPVRAVEKHYLFFIESEYFPERIAGWPTELFTELVGLLAEKLNLLHLLRRQMGTALQSEEHRAKATSERLSKLGDVFITPSMQKGIGNFDQAALSDASILIEGETGVGKEGLARRVHEQSGRRGSFVPVHLSGMQEHLFESEFFGHEKGAFTGAHQRKSGLFEIADKGTLFIDEAGDIPVPIQVKLLRVLQEKNFFRVGGVREVRSDFRLVSATNRDLAKMVEEGSFRRDLYYRISVIPFLIPPLRQHPDDILFLARKFVEYFSRRYNKPSVSLSDEQRAQLVAYRWPGNIRELKSVLERAVILSTDGSLHLHLSNSFPEGHTAAPHQPETQSLPSLWKGLPSMEEIERRYIAHVLKLTKGRVNGSDGALAVLGMKRSTLYLKIKKFKLDAVTQFYGDRDGNA